MEWKAFDVSVQFNIKPNATMKFFHSIYFSVEFNLFCGHVGHHNEYKELLNEFNSLLKLIFPLHFGILYTNLMKRLSPEAGMKSDYCKEVIIIWNFLQESY